jgi:hypothetical protein
MSATLAKRDLHHMTVVAWCIHPDLIPVEKIMFMPEPDMDLLWGPPLFINPEDIIYHNQPMLSYRISIDIIDIEDWHTPSVSSLSGGSDLGSDGDDYIYQASSGPWPKRTCFPDQAVEGNKEGDDPSDGVGDGVAVRVKRHIITAWILSPTRMPKKTQASWSVTC